jgi:hypothetical protein
MSPNVLEFVIWKRILLDLPLSNYVCVWDVATYHEKHSWYGFDFQVYYSGTWALYKEQEQFNQREMTYVFVLRGLFQLNKINQN